VPRGRDHQRGGGNNTGGAQRPCGRHRLVEATILKDVKTPQRAVCELVGGA
jgi:hypothetical protein